MPRRSINRLIGACAGVALALAGCDAQQAAPAPADRPELAVMTSLPIFWAEGDVGAMLSGDHAGHWVKQALEARFRPVPVDRLTQIGDRGFLLLAQPRALAGDENVALDDWVRGGGHVLLLADPMLTAHSEYGLGDARAPQPVALLSPRLARWGLELTFDPASSPNDGVSDGPLAIPVRMAGRWRLTGGGHESRCKLSENALVAHCQIGAGTALLLADAALVEDGDHPDESARAALEKLLDSAFGAPDA